MLTLLFLDVLRVLYFHSIKFQFLTNAVFNRSSKCHEIGYAKRQRSNKSVSPDRGTPLDKGKSLVLPYSNGHLYSDGGSRLKETSDIASDVAARYSNHEKPTRSHNTLQECMPNGKANCIDGLLHSRVDFLVYYFRNWSMANSKYKNKSPFRVSLTGLNERNLLLSMQK